MFIHCQTFFFLHKRKILLSATLMAIVFQRVPKELFFGRFIWKLMYEGLFED